jgi:hypothetical protein
MFSMTLPSSPRRAAQGVAVREFLLERGEEALGDQLRAHLLGHALTHDRAATQSWLGPGGVAHQPLDAFASDVDAMAHP